MKSWSVAAIYVSSVLVAPALGYPGMGKTLAELKARQSDGGDSTELIGDLIYPDNQLTPVGKQVKAIITGSGDPESSVRWTSYPKKDTPQCAADVCCIWQYIANDMQRIFTGRSGRCTNYARAAVRLGFHDAAGWSKATAPGGGADGSIILAAVEMQRKENKGLEEIVAQMKIWYNTYHKYGVSMADLIQMGATVAAVVCPLGPRIRSWVGRRDSSAACPDGLLPPVTGSADFLVSLFQNKTIQPHGLTALIGAHTTSQQRFVDPSRAGDPQDGTPGTWDVLFYKQTLLARPPKRIFRFQSDLVLSQDPRISGEFQEFAGPGGQDHWNEDYAREYIRVSMLGVYNINNLTECTKVLPPSTGWFTASDQKDVDRWVQTTKNYKEIAQALLDGELITNYSALLANESVAARWHSQRRGRGT